MPLGDDNSLRKSVPIVTWTLIALNILFFLVELSGGEQFITQWAFTPSLFKAAPADNFVTIFTSMFMHGGWGHLVGNMLYLWIFGDNVEDVMGKPKFLLFYLLCGIAATFAQFSFNSASTIPNLGASGAIAGVLGAYILYFPKSQINVLVGRSMTRMPALIVIGFWFILQFISSVASTVSVDADVGGVAYLAHVGGFIAGLGLAVPFRGSKV